MKVTPGILESNWQEIEHKAVLCANKDSATLVQIDICDGEYVESSTWPYNTAGQIVEDADCVAALEILRKQNIVVEFDLMIKNPQESLIRWLSANPRRVVLHVGSAEDLSYCFAILHGYSQDYPKFEYGIAVTVNDDFSIYQKLLKRVHFVQIMGIERIGVQGQSFSTRVFDVIARIQQFDPELPIQIDGGVSEFNILALRDAGATSVVCGSAIFGSENPRNSFEQLQGQVQ